MKDFFVPKDLLLFSDSMGINSDFSVRGFSAGVAEDEGTLTVSAVALPAGINFVGEVTLATSTVVSTITLDLPSGVQPGDLVLACVGTTTTADVDILVSSGYTEVVDIYSNDNRDANLGIFYKVMGDPVDTTVTVPGSTGTNYSVVAWAGVYRGVDATSPLDVTTVTATGINSAAADSPAITPLTDGAIVFSIVSAGIDHATYGGESTQNVSAPTGFSLIYFGHKNSVSKSVASLGVASRPWATGDGAIDPPAWSTIYTYSATNSSWAAASLALRPA